MYQQDKDNKHMKINEQKLEILADSPRVDDNLLKTLERAEGVPASQHNFTGTQQNDIGLGRIIVWPQQTGRLWC